MLRLPLELDAFDAVRPHHAQSMVLGHSGAGAWQAPPRGLERSDRGDDRRPIRSWGARYGARMQTQCCAVSSSSGSIAARS